VIDAIKELGQVNIDGKFPFAFNYLSHVKNRLLSILIRTKAEAITMGVGLLCRLLTSA